MITMHSSIEYKKVEHIQLKQNIGIFAKYVGLLIE